jgi:hypothetical protein
MVIGFLDNGRLVEGTPLDLALNFACDMLACLCKATSDVIKSSETTPGAKTFLRFSFSTNYPPYLGALTPETIVKTWKHYLSGTYNCFPETYCVKTTRKSARM